MSAMNHSVWRISMARSLAPGFTANPKVEAAFVFGSAALGCSDQYSDLELGIVWSDLPSAAELQTSVQQIGVAGWELEPYGTQQQAWLEQFYWHGMKIEAGHWARATIDSMITDVVERYDVSQTGLLFEKQAMAANLCHAVILYGEVLIKLWQERLTPYPEGLAVAMVQQHLQFRPFNGQEILAERREIPLLYENHCAIVRWLLNLLFGLNRIYHPGFKWIAYWVEAMALKPLGLFERLERVFQSDPLSGTRELRQLVQETFELVDQHVPQVDLRPQCSTFNRSYPKLPIDGGLDS